MGQHPKQTDLHFRTVFLKYSVCQHGCQHLKIKKKIYPRINLGSEGYCSLYCQEFYV